MAYNNSSQAYDSNTLELIMNAHGGLDRWKQFSQINVSLYIRGNLLAYKFLSPFKRKLDVTIETKKLRVVLDPFPTAGLIGVFEGNYVYISEKVTGKKILELQSARKNCKTKLIWNKLNLLYFLGYAFWNYMNTPFIFSLDGFTVKELPKTSIANKYFYTFEINFPDSIPTHCNTQRFYFDENGLLQRLDYVAEIFGDFVSGAHMCENHKVFNGFSIPTHRIVYAKYGSTPIHFFPSAMEGWIENVEFI